MNRRSETRSIVSSGKTNVKNQAKIAVQIPGINAEQAQLYRVLKKYHR